ncbi:hypothetical protein CCACVL1_30782 [Corchorus capsularis]|uniref:Uncharacterized protein n=1 Tax=Corchorus capsularis TaxID=210143 RepID=A0A1R3FVH9_COCAP|nr:hypothetical protein CCACVL1_30782 [Corchorus capsularis]
MPQINSCPDESSPALSPALSKKKGMKNDENPPLK